MSITQLTADLQRTANIDKIRQVQLNINAAKRKERIRERLEEAKELNFDDELQCDY